MGKIPDKTNAVRSIEAAGIPHVVRSYEADGSMTGVDIARVAGVDVDTVFKTLVTVGKSGQHYVFMVPVACELDLKKAAIASGEKSIQMIKSKELLGLTGYIHGGCSPIGMKKLFPTFIDETAEIYDEIAFSGGRIGLQLQCAADDLIALVNAKYADITA